jgi:hypothetical protein
MTALNRNPVNTNLLQPTKFLLTFSRTPNAQYFCEEVNLPGLTVSETIHNTPLVDLYSPGTKLIYDYFSVTFKVDEDLQVYSDIHDWLRGMAPVTVPDDFNALKARVMAQTTRPEYSDGILTIMSNLNNPKIYIKFKNLYPTNLTALDFSTKDSADTIVTTSVNFRFDYYDIERVS